MQIALNYEALPEQIASFRSAATAIGSAVDDVETAVQTAQRGFVGMAADSYSQAQAKWNDGVRELVNFLNGMADFLETVGETYKAQEDNTVDLLS